MMWLCRAGQKSQFFDKFISENRVYLAWEGYATDLRTLENREQFRNLVAKEKGVDNRTSISNWSGQLFNMANDMEVGDYVVIPDINKREYVLARVVGDYEYVNDSALHHSRKIEIVKEHISRDIFSQPVLYALGAYRTICKIKPEKEFLKELEV